MRLTALFAALLLASSCALATGAGKTTLNADSGKTTLNFVNAQIPEVIRAISHISQRNFLVDPRVKGTINIVSATPVSAQEAYNMLLSALRLQGYAAVESNGVTKIMPEAQAKLYIGSVSRRRSGKDRVVTRIFPIQYGSAAQMVGVIRPLVSPSNVVTAYPDTNTLVVTDYASNLTRIEELVRDMDRPSGDMPVIIPVKYLSAVDLADTINRLMQDPGQNAAGRFVLMADARTNSLLLRSSSPGRVAHVRELVSRLDVKTKTPGNIHVIYLKNADATHLAKTLRGILSGNSPLPASSSSSARTAQRAPVSSGSGETPGGMVQADEPTNSLIIVAPDAVYDNLRAVVDMLDVRRAQVFVEALIAEVSADKVAQFGIQWQMLSGAAGTGTTSQGFGGTNFGARGANGNIIDVSGNLGTVSQGLNIGVVKGQITLPGIGTVLNLGALANALEQDAHANILSTPDLLTLDNQEAKIVIGQNVPFITGQYAQTGSATTATPFQTIDRKDVGLTLKIKPQITAGGTVKLQIYQEVSSVDAASLTNPAGLITNKRSLQSTVLVDEGQTIVLGGLIQDTISTGESKVPLLGDIPLLGALFRYQTRHHTKTDLMIFIRPHILREKEDSVSLSQDRYDQLRMAEKNSQPGWSLVMPNDKVPQLPPRDVGGQAAPAGGTSDATSASPDAAVALSARLAGNAIR